MYFWRTQVLAPGGAWLVTFAASFAAFLDRNAMISDMSLCTSMPMPRFSLKKKRIRETLKNPEDTTAGEPLQCEFTLEFLAKSGLEDTCVRFKEQETK